MGPPLNLHPHPTKKKNKKLQYWQGCRCLPGREPSGTRRSAVTAERTETDIRQGGFGVPARVRRGVERRRFYFINLYFVLFFVFLPVALPGFSGIVLGQKRRMHCSPGEQQGSDRQQTNWMIQATELGGRGSDWGRWHVKDCSRGDAALKSPR